MTCLHVTKNYFIMCLSCVCGLLCKIISFIISLLFIVGLVLLILWLTGILFGKPDSTPTHANYESIRSILHAGGGGN
uniref:Uncharacterized protein n=1 Tax=Pararge aegeria TaxID=116150 RepID=S4PPQ5_9NEOP